MGNLDLPLVVLNRLNDLFLMLKEASRCISFWGIHIAVLSWYTHLKHLSYFF